MNEQDKLKPIANMNWKSWKKGFRFALWSALFLVMINMDLVFDVDWRKGIKYICSTIGATMLAYMQKHPIDSFSSDTNFVSKTETKNQNITI